MDKNKKKSSSGETAAEIPATSENESISQTAAGGTHEAASAEAPPPKNSEALIYVGAALPFLARYTSVIGKLPSAWEFMFRSEDDRYIIEKLMIPHEQLKSFGERVKKEGSPENIRYRRSCEIAKEMRKHG